MSDKFLIEKPFGVLFRLPRLLKSSDLEWLRDHFAEMQRFKKVCFVDFHNIERIPDNVLIELIDRINTLAELGLKTHVTRVRPELKRSLLEANLLPSVFVVDRLDEAVFPTKSLVKSKLSIPASPSKTIICPACSHPVRPGAYKCLQCGTPLYQRRGERGSVALPFLYGYTHNKEFINSSWIGGVTEDLDIQTFSGIGFFSSDPIQQGVELHFIFPTILPRKVESNRSTLIIFRGRVKHCQDSGEWQRIGIALVNMFEYSGRFDIQEDLDDDF